MAYLDDAATRFMKTASALPTLSRDEEYELVTRWKSTGDKAAADRVLEANLRYVAQIAWKYRNRGIQLSDLLSEGCVGLSYALTKFEPERGLRFVTYAANWIRAKILAYLVNNSRQVRIGTDPVSRRIFFSLRREHAKALALLGDENEAIAATAAAARITPARAEFELRRLPDVAVDHEIGDFSPLSRMPAPDLSPEEQVIAREEQHHTAALSHSILHALDPRELAIIKARYCVDKEDAATLAGLARQFGLSRERVRQLEARALKKLRARVGDSSAV